MTIYVTKQGDVVDQIAKDELGDESQCTAIFDINPGLAAAGHVLPAGLLITLPEAVEAVTSPQIRLWGSAS